MLSCGTAVNKYNFVMRLFFVGLICNLNASPEKDVDSFFDSLLESRWLSSTIDKRQNKVVLTENDDLYRVIREKFIQTLRGKRIHSLTYVNYLDEHGIATIMDHDEDSVKIRLVNNEIGKVDGILKNTHDLQPDSIVSEWNEGKDSLGAKLQIRRSERLYEGMLQLRVTGFLRACFSYEKKQDLESIISLKKKKLITFEQALTTGLYHEYNIEKCYWSYFQKYAADWSKINNVLLETWGSQYVNFEEYFHSPAGIQSRSRWTSNLNSSL